MCVCVCAYMYVCICVRAWALSHIWLFSAPWTIAHQAPLSVRFPRQEYWRGLPFPSPGDLPDPGIKPTSLVSPALAGGFSTSWATRETHDFRERVYLVSGKQLAIREGLGFFGYSLDQEQWVFGGSDNLILNFYVMVMSLTLVHKVWTFGQFS